MGARYIRIYDKSYPAIFSTLTELSYGMGAVNRQDPERTFFDIPVRFLPDLENIDCALEHLTKEEIITFCDGEESEIEDIAHRNPNLQIANDLLNAMFDGEGSL